MLAGEGAITEELIHWSLWRLPLPRLLLLLQARAHQNGQQTARPARVELLWKPKTEAGVAPAAVVESFQY